MTGLRLGNGRDRTRLENEFRTIGSAGPDETVGKTSVYDSHVSPGMMKQLASWKRCLLQTRQLIVFEERFLIRQNLRELKTMSPTQPTDIARFPRTANTPTAKATTIASSDVDGETDAMKACQPRRTRTIKIAVATFLLAAVGGSLPSQTEASHSVFKRALQEHYNFASVSCNTCHVPDEDRAIRNDLGNVFVDRLKGQDLSERFFAAQRRGFDERREFEKLMQGEFLQVLRQIEDNRTDNGQTFGQRFRSGGFEGLRLR